MSNDSFKNLLKEYAESSLLKISTAGSVDDGKSTFIGRLLYDSQNIYEDTIQSVQNVNLGNKEGIDLAQITDGLKSEREQGITIDVAYRYFSTPKRKFILADTPGHEQYTRNMATGASNSDVAIILVDARLGVLPQTKRHSTIASLLGVKHFAVAINKMDLVDYSEERFKEIVDSYTSFASKLRSPNDIQFFPMSALHGDNICFKSDNTPWYKGNTVLNYLEELYISGDRNLIDLRMPVQGVIRPNLNFRGYTGQIISGVMKEGSEITILPSMKSTKIKKIHTYKKTVEKAYPPMSVVVETEDDIDIGRGDMIVAKNNQPNVSNKIEALVVWMNETPLKEGRKYVIQHTTRTLTAKVDKLIYDLDINTTSRNESSELKLNHIGRVSFQLSQKIFWDSYEKNRYSGSFVIIDPEDNNTAGACMIIDRQMSHKTDDNNQDSDTLRKKLFGHEAQVLVLDTTAYQDKAFLEKELLLESCFTYSPATINQDSLDHLINAGLIVIVSQEMVKSLQLGPSTNVPFTQDWVALTIEQLKKSRVINYEF